MPYRNPGLKITPLAGVHDEGALQVRVERGAVAELKLDIYRPPRFFEAFLHGRSHTEPPGIAARICSNCPAAYQQSACNALEDVCGVDLDEGIRALRRLLSCGEWIASHARHVHLLHAPDFLGYDSVIDLARERRDLVERGLTLRKTGHDIVQLVGGHGTHPVNVRVGGFHHLPDADDLHALARHTLRPALEDALATVGWVAGFDFPDFTHDHGLLALTTPDRYPIESGTPTTSDGRSYPLTAFENHILQPQQTRRYLAGPAARYALNAQHLSPLAAEAAIAAKLPETYRNPYRSIVVRAVETVYALEEALSLIDRYAPPARAHVDVHPRPGTGFGACESPRGLLFQRYTLAADGTVTAAKIVPPTSVNRMSIEHDLQRVVQNRLDLGDRLLRLGCEQAIRNYDPCVSGTARFLNLTVVRS